MILVTGCNPLGCRLTDALSAELAKSACDHHCPEIPRGWLTYDAMSQESIIPARGRAASLGHHTDGREQ